MKKHYGAVIAVLFALVSFGCPAKSPQTPMERIDAIIAAGDTITESGLYTPFVISGATITPEMYRTEPLLVPSERVAYVDAPDSYLGIVMHHNSDVIACRKKYITLLFPNARTFVVDCHEVSRAEFDRIPAALLRTVKGEDNGRKLVIETCSDVDAPSPAYSTSMDAERSWFTTHHP